MSEFSLFFICHHKVGNLLEQREPGLITRSDKTVWAMCNCNSRFAFLCCRPAVDQSRTVQLWLSTENSVVAKVITVGDQILLLMAITQANQADTAGDCLCQKTIFSSPGRSPGRAIVLPPALVLVLALAAALALAKSLTLTFFM